MTGGRDDGEREDKLGTRDKGKAEEGGATHRALGVIEEAVDAGCEKGMGREQE